MNLFQLRGIDNGANIDGFIEAVAKAQLFNAWYQFLDQLFAHCAMHDDAATGGTALSCCAVGAPKDALDGKIKVGIVKDDHGIFATHLQRNTFE